MKDDRLISLNAAIDALGEEPLVWHDGEDEIAERNQWRRDVAAIKALPSAQPGWIPCEERLPEPGVNVLVDVLDIPAGDRFPLVDKIGDDGDWCNCYGEWFAVAWMPLPSPWEGRQDG